MKPGEPKKNHHQSLLAATLQDVGQKGHETFSSSVMAGRHRTSASFLSATKVSLAFVF